MKDGDLYERVCAKICYECAIGYGSELCIDCMDDFDMEDLRETRFKEAKGGRVNFEIYVNKFFIN